jgi:hypothetical protein
MRKILLPILFCSCSLTTPKAVTTTNEAVSQTVSQTIHSQATYPKTAEETLITVSDNNLINYSHKIVTSDIVPSIIISSSSNTVSKTAEISVPVTPKPLTLWEKIKRQFTFYSLLFCGVCFFFPSAGLIIFKFLYNRTSNCLTTVVAGIDEFNSKDKAQLTNTLSRKMEKSQKNLIKKIKVGL